MTFGHWLCPSLASDAFVRTNHRTIDMMFIRLSVCLGWVCIVIIRCTLARIYDYGWIVQCIEHPDTKACTPTVKRFFQFHLEERWGVDECKLGEELNASNDK